METKIVAAVTLFVLTLASGIWLSHLGKPLNSLILTIHKLIALGAVIFTVLAIIRWLQNVNARIFALTMVVVTGLLVVVLFVTGALLSLGKPMPGIVLTAHKVGALLAIISGAVLILTRL